MAALDDSYPEIHTFEKEVLRAETEVESCFVELITYLKHRKNVLLKRIQDLGDDYRKAHKNQKQFSRVVEVYTDMPQTEYTEGGQDNTNWQENGDRTSETNKRILFDFDTTLLDKVRKFGGISVTDVKKSFLPVVEYKHKVTPVVREGGVANSADGQFNRPWGLAIDYSSNNIYVADHENHRVQVFNDDGDFLFKFGHQNGLCKMRYPVCIAIFQERVFVSQQALGCLLVYDLYGNFIDRIGNQGPGEGDFDDPRGLAIHPDSGDVCVCDQLNHRVQILSDYVIMILRHDLLNSPVSISLTEHSIFVLARTSPFLFEFDYYFKRSNNKVLSSVSRFVELSYSVCIDGAGRFLVADNVKSCITILDEEGNLLHSLWEGISKPMGVTVDAKGGIVVADFNHTLLIF